MRQKESLAEIHMPREIARDVSNFVESLKKEMGSNLLSVVAFGASVTGEYVHWKTSVNLLIVVEKTDLDSLNRAAQVAGRWLRRFPLDPVIMTPRDLVRCRDAIPLELMDMHHRHRLLYGKIDPVDDIEIDGNTLRQELEHSLCKIVAELRSRFLRVVNDERGMTELMTDTIERFLTVMTCLLFLHGKQPPARVRDLCVQIQFEFHLDGDTLLALAEVKAGKKSLKRGEALLLFNQYLQDVEKILQVVDEMALT